MNICPFPIKDVLEFRDESRRTAAINRIEASIRAKEQEMAKLAHEVWLLRLEKEGLNNG